MSGREIKFRSWVVFSGINPIKPCMNYNPEFNGDINDIFSRNEAEPSHKYGAKITYLQFTGLRDNKRTEEYPRGQEVYEGDIFQHQFGDKIRGIIKLGEYQNPNDDNHGGHVGFYIDWKGDNGLYRKDLAYWVKVSRVIGNIFENHELMGDKR